MILPTEFHGIAVRHPIRSAIILLCGLCISTGCLKTAPATGNRGPNSDCVPAFPDQSVTYENYVSSILAAHCTVTCHRGGNTAGTGDFTTYEGVSLHTGDIFYYRVIQDNADMPEGNAPLPKAVRDSLNVWIRNCAPEN